MPHLMYMHGGRVTGSLLVEGEQQAPRRAAAAAAIQQLAKGATGLCLPVHAVFRRGRAASGQGGEAGKGFFQGVAP